MPSSEQSELLATPCVTCREHHLKCDRMVPKCTRCVRAGRECKLGFKFKPSKDTFPRDQRWPKPARKLTYVDETRGLVGGSPLENTSLYELHIGENYARDPESASSSITPPAIPSPRDHIRSVNQPVERNDKTSSSSEGTPTAEFRRRRGLSDSKPSARCEMYSLQVGNNAHVPSRGDNLSPDFHTFSRLPLESTTEARLFLHYIQKLAICLDLCDPQRHFELIVPERAANCDTLLNAILAIAALHLSHTTDFDKYTSLEYHNRSIEGLKSSRISDENVFAAIIILRMLEEMDVPTTGKDGYRHLLGVQKFGDHYMEPGTLRAASFWVGLRQEIYIAVITQRKVKLNLEHFVVDRSFDPTDDYTWSNRAVVLLADVLNFCFGDHASPPDRWRALAERCKKWSITRPQSFNPFYFCPRTARTPFPEIWYSSSCHIIGIQHHILAQLFLTQFDPSIPKVGPNRRAANEKRTSRIENLVRELCGIGVWNQWTPPSMFTACMGIAMFGDQFMVRSDQDALIEILRKTERDHARPTAAIQAQLQKDWGWNAENSE